MAQEWILQVSDLNEYVRKTLAADPMLRNVKLRGEISNFKRHTSGHWYFTLKDERARIACVMFRQNAMMQSIRPQEEQVWIVFASRTCCTCEIGNFIPHTAQQPLDIGDITIWSFL